MTNFSAGIIIIGDEILSGRTLDTNSNFLAKKLIDSGIQLEEIIVIHDIEKEIIDNVLKFHNKYTYVFTTGGIGPTHDDITSKSISKAFNMEYCIHPKAFKILENYYPKGEFNEGRQKMAMMPKDVELIPNPLTVAPGFILKNIYVLPGVPEIMKKMVDYVFQNIKKGKPKNIITINTNLFESSIAFKLNEIQNRNQDCSIGSYPYFNYVEKTGGVNIVISSWKINDLDDIAQEVSDMISLLGGKSSKI